MTDIMERLGVLAASLANPQVAVEAQRELELLRAENTALIAFLQKQRLLVHVKMCTRPDNTLGPAWVLHRVWSVDGGSCLGWHEDDPRAAVAAAEIGRRIQDGNRND